MNYVVRYGSTFLSDFGEFWTRWVCDPKEARTFASRAEAENVAYAVEGEAVSVEVVS